MKNVVVFNDFSYYNSFLIYIVNVFYTGAFSFFFLIFYG